MGLGRLLRVDILAEAKDELRKQRWEWKGEGDIRERVSWKRKQYLQRSPKKLTFHVAGEKGCRKGCHKIKLERWGEAGSFQTLWTNESDANLKAMGSQQQLFFLSYLFIWVHWVLAAACGIFILTFIMNPQLQHVEYFFKLWHVESLDVACKLLSCSMWDLVPDQGSNLGPLHWELGVLATGPPGKSQQFLIKDSNLSFRIPLKKI